MKDIKDFKIILKENDNLKINLPSNYNNESSNEFLGKKREIESISKPIINTKIIVNSEYFKNSKNKENNNKSNKQQILKKGCLETSKIPFTCGEYFYFEKHKIGIGSFGNVFCGTHKIKNFKVAIKVPNDKANSEMIDLEVKYTKLLQKETGFPSLFHSYNINKKNIIVESLLGPSLDKLFNYCGKKFPLKTVCLIGVEILKRLQSMHKYGLIHRDLKPNNFTWGNFSINNNNNNLINNEININKEYNITTLYLIDFGLSCPYMDMSNGLLYGNSKGNKFVGTLRYSSINSHKGVRLCRKDDLESLMYILIYFYKGKLPWQDVDAKDEKEKQEKVKEQKTKITTAELCEGMPDEFEKMLCYIKNILFDEYPNYNKLFNYLKSILDRIKTDNNEENEFNYIWEKLISEDCIEAESINLNSENKKDNINKIFQGYPEEIKKYIRKKYSNKANRTNISIGSSSDTKSNLSTSNSSETNK